MRVQTHWFLVVVNAYLRTVQVLNSDKQFVAEIVKQVRNMVRFKYALYCSILIAHSEITHNMK